MTSRQQNNKTITGRVKSFFQEKNWEKILTFSFFLLIAFGFWLLQYLQQKFDIELSVPLDYKNKPAEIVLSDSLPEEIKLKISDKGTILLNYTISKKFDPIDINLKNIRPDETSHTISQAYLEKEISKRLASSTVLLGYSPDKLTVNYLPLRKKEIPVHISGSVSLATGYMFADSLHIDPERITVFGNNEVLDTLQAIYTEPVELSNLDKSFEKKVKLKLSKNLTTDQKEVVLFGTIEGFTEKTITVPINCVNLPEGYIVRLFPSTVEIICRIALNKYSSVEQDSFSVQIDYNKLIQSKKLSTPIEVSMKPQWLKNYRISPENVEFLIEKKIGL